jgi:hypothetical protein
LTARAASGGIADKFRKAMRPKLLCAVSLLLNVALAGYWLKARGLVAPPQQTNLSSSTQTHGLARLPARYWSPTPIKTAPSQAPNPSPWSRIESTDYPAFIANLRATGCPERTIRDIVVPEVDALYLRMDSEPVPGPDDLWLPQDDRAKQARAQQMAESDRAAERRDLLRTLLGVEGTWPKGSLDRPEEWASFCAVVVPATFETGEALAWELDRMDFRRVRFNVVTEWPLKLSEIESLRQLRDDGFNRLFALAGRDRVDEVLRLASALIVLSEVAHGDDPASRISAEEMHRIVACQGVDVSLVDGAFNFEIVARLDRFKAGLSKTVSRKADGGFAGSLVRALGEPRAEELIRRLQPGWAEADQFARANQLPGTVAEALVDARTLADTEAVKVRSDPALSAEEEQERLRQIGSDVRAALQETMPPALWDQYRTNRAGWIQKIENGQWEGVR